VLTAAHDASSGLFPQALYLQWKGTRTCALLKHWGVWACCQVHQQEKEGKEIDHVHGWLLGCFEDDEVGFYMYDSRKARCIFSLGWLWQTIDFLCRDSL
jgi:hypothetical protein